MTRPVSEADLRAHLREHCVEGIEGPLERIRSCIDGTREDLASAADDVNAYRSRTAASDVEDAAMLMGEAVGYALGYRIPAGEGHHWAAIRLLALYLQWSMPAVAREARQLEMLRSYRHRVKYDGAEAPMAQTRMHYEAVRAIYEAIKDDLPNLPSQRHNRGG